MDKLLIIESPNKIKTLRQYLGSEFEIIATIGHIRDLSQYGMGFNADFEPKWVIPEAKKNKKETSKKEIIDQIKKEAKKAKEIYIATDPDREGEAIAWHVFEVLDDEDKLKCKRVTFNEITKNAILESFNHKRDIDLNWVHSQFARRVIDRLIGFKLSKLMQNKLKADSAGRVQSVALKFIEDREKLISNFTPEFWWTIDVVLEDKNELILKNIDSIIDAKLCEKQYSIGINFVSHDDANKVFSKLSDEFKITNIEDPSFYTSNPKPPYKTSTLQQDAINKLGWTSKKTTLVAQRLYEGIEVDGKQIALISYPRTDSLRLSDSFVGSAFKFINETYGEEFAGKYTVKKQKNEENVQDAHEAIRPIDPYLKPSELKSKINKDDFLLYQLIYNRAIGSLMSAAKFKKVTIKLDNNNNEFYTFSRECVFLGYRKIYVDENEEKDKLIDLSKYEVGKTIKSKTKEIKEHQTTPPARYTQATLIAELEDAGVGRPSTYNTMANVALDRGYAIVDKKSYVMTDIGKTVVAQLDKFFPSIINKDFTKQMEEHLDEIASGNEGWKAWIQQFEPNFNNDLKNAYDKMEKIADEQVGRDCPECNHPLVYKRAKKGGSKFIACSNFPTCKHIESLEQARVLEDKCPECNSLLLMRKSKKGSTFVGCKGYPKCNYIMSDKLYEKYKQDYPNQPLPKTEQLNEYKKEANIRKFARKKS